MFGWLRRRTGQGQATAPDVATEAAGQTQQFMRRVATALGTMPGEMLSDPFVVGAIAAHAAITFTVMSNGQCELADTERAMVIAVSMAIPGHHLTEAAALEAIRTLKSHAEYARAAQMISLILGARYGRSDLAEDPLIVRAKRKVEAMSRAERKALGDSEAEQVASQLGEDLFLKILREKYVRRQD